MKNSAQAPILKNAPRWLIISLITTLVSVSIPGLSRAKDCPVSQRNQRWLDAMSGGRSGGSASGGSKSIHLIQPRSGTEPLTIDVSQNRKLRCPDDQHLFKGRCLNNKVLDGLEVCGDTNCTQACEGCARGTVSCYPRPDKAEVYVCIDCMSNKNCRKGYTCNQYRCVPKSAASSPSAPVPDADEDNAPATPQP